MENSQIAEPAHLKDTFVLTKDLDPEWVELIKEAKRCGLTIEEVRSFLKLGKGA